MWLDWVVIFCIYLFRGELLQLFLLNLAHRYLTVSTYFLAFANLLTTKQNTHILVPLPCYCDLEWSFFSLLWCKQRYEALYLLSVLTTGGRQVFHSPDVKFWFKTAWWEWMIGLNKLQGETSSNCHAQVLENFWYYQPLIYTDCSGRPDWRVNKLIAGVFLGMRSIDF